MALSDMIMPQLGESVAEGTILKWLKNVGDTVEPDEMILEISTDKVDSEIPAPVGGRIAEVLFQEGDVVPVRTVIARIETDANAQLAASDDTPPAEEVKPATPAAAPAPAAAVPAPAAETTVTLAPSNGGRFYSPLVRRMASEHQVSAQELETITGSGAGGRVTRKDFEAWLPTRSTTAPSAQSAPAASSPAPAAASANTVEAGNPFPTLGIEPGPDVNIVPMDSMRKSIGKHMWESKRTSPHVLSVHEVDLTDIAKWRDKHKEAFFQQNGFKLTFTPILFTFVVKALKEFSWVNASVDGTNVVEHKRVNLGMAVALPDGGLTVPVIKNADELNLLGMCRAVDTFAKKARNRELSFEDLEGGTFSVTNPGVFGTVLGFPIISQPQVAILGFNAIVKRPVVLENDAIAVRHMMNLCLAYDHRIVDGMLGGLFLKRLAELIGEFDVSREP